MKKRYTAGLAMLTAGIMLFAGSAEAAVYTVKSGDTLWKISQTYGTTASKLIQVNQLTSEWIYPGQQLQVPGTTPYKVQNGESMWDISRKQGVALADLIAANPQISNPNNIWNGLSVTIPDKFGAAAAAPSASAAQPAKFADGQFPLKKGTYTQPITNNYAAERYWSENGDEIRQHEGVDIMADKGTPIYSVLDGEIVNFGWNDLGGWRITVRVDDTTQFYYAHLNGYAGGIGKGSKIKKGQLIGYVGSTGYGPEGTQGLFEPHLHFGIYSTTPSWHSIDPFAYLKWWEQKN
ncbi:M23 family metallopeptidase [Paenibacillus piri]|uniref:M23 family metallopeptidase n=1 Tax=Paenibacillus piri TaxID=2547395 RepID=A0A4R5KQJ5_9BACL|nr:M23 family metallopeptidase [Paenibacillus piri]TDF98011.1 M23 family metallopeptidase [Paenibacillus piri]